MAQVDKITVKKLAVGAGVLAIGALCIKLLLTPSASVTQLDAAAMRAVSTEGTFKTVQGNGSRRVHVFLSTECSFCRKIEPELEKLQNVTVYRHLLPGTTDETRARALAVWCAADQVSAWKKVAAGMPVSPATCDGAGLEKNLLLGKRLGLTSTPSIVYENRQVSTGMLSSRDITTYIETPGK